MKLQAKMSFEIIWSTKLHTINWFVKIEIRQ